MIRNAELAAEPGPVPFVRRAAPGTNDAAKTAQTGGGQQTYLLVVAPRHQRGNVRPTQVAMLDDQFHELLVLERRPNMTPAESAGRCGGVGLAWRRRRRLRLGP